MSYFAMCSNHLEYFDFFDGINIEVFAENNLSHGKTTNYMEGEHNLFIGTDFAQELKEMDTEEEEDFGAAFSFEEIVSKIELMRHIPHQYRVLFTSPGTAFWGLTDSADYLLEKTNDLLYGSWPFYRNKFLGSINNGVLCFTLEKDVSSKKILMTLGNSSKAETYRLGSVSYGDFTYLLISGNTENEKKEYLAFFFNNIYDELKKRDGKKMMGFFLPFSETEIGIGVPKKLNICVDYIID